MRALLAAVLACLVLAGCAGEDSYQNARRPPAPINVTVAVDEGTIRVTPPSFGAGPVVLVVANESGTAQQLTFETDEIGGPTGGIRRSTRRIADGATATLQVDPRPGRYRLGTGSDAVRAATVEVTASRPSAQDALLLP